MTEDEKRAAGLLFDPRDPALMAQKRKTHDLSTRYNSTLEEESEVRTAILREIFGNCGQTIAVQGPIYIHYGCHTTVGDCFFANFNLTIQDDAAVTIGDHCDFGPNVTIVTPLHPLLGRERQALSTESGEEKRLCYAKPVTIGNRCWICAGVTICPGVTIGDDCVIAAGSVVTRDIPAGSLAAGVPCRVLRPITEADSIYRSRWLWPRGEV